MTTYRQLIYFVLDLLKISGDDSYYTEDHVIFLLDKFRATLLEQKYKNKQAEVDDSNYQTICLNIEEKELIEGLHCAGSSLRSIEKIPALLSLGSPKIYTSNQILPIEITFVSTNRFKYVGNNEWLKNILYATESDDYIYLKSSNPQHKYLEKITIKGLFSSTEDAEKLSCSNSESSSCDILDHAYPIEESLVVPMIELAAKELSGGLYKPKDSENNASDDLSSLATFIARHAKSNLQKQIEGNG